MRLQHDQDQFAELLGCQEVENWLKLYQMMSIPRREWALLVFMVLVSIVGVALLLTEYWYTPGRSSATVSVLR